MKRGITGTLELIEQLKGVVIEVVAEYKNGYVDQRGNFVPPSPEKIGYLLSSLVQVAKLEREIEAEANPTQGLAMVPWDI